MSLPKKTPPPRTPIPSKDFISIRRRTTVAGATTVRTSQNGEDEKSKVDAEQENDSKKWHSPVETPPPNGIIIPTAGSWKQRWDLGILVLILYSSVVVPYRVCFDEDASGIAWIFEASMSFFFLFDVFLNFRTAYFQEGQWVTSEAAIAKLYLRGWFWIDAPSSFPLELLDLLPGANASDFAILRVLRMFRLVRLLKLLKVDQIIGTLEEMMETRLRIIPLLFLVGKMVFLAHALGCFWYAIGAWQAGDGSSGTATWITSYGGEDERTAGEYYIWSIYWALTTLTTVGYGDIIPTNDIERLYCLMALLLSALVFGAMISNISTLVASLDRQAAIIEEKTNEVKEYAVARGLPKALTFRVRKHFQYFYTQRPPFDEIQLLNDCPPALRLEITHFLLAETLAKVALFKGLDHEFLGEIFPYIRPISYDAKSTIYTKGETSRELLFLLEGEVEVMSNRFEGVVETLITPSEIIFARVNSGVCIRPRTRSLHPRSHIMPPSLHCRDSTRCSRACSAAPMIPRSRSSTLAASENRCSRGSEGTPRMLRARRARCSV
jgi:hypothetical protein|eukprot:985086-Prymnesium_polylepis.2